MKFSNKIVIGTCLIIAVCFSVGGIVMVQRNFSVAYKKDIENYTKQHIINRYSLESNIKNAMEYRNITKKQQNDFEDMVNDYAEKISNYGNEKSQLLVQNAKGNTIYGNVTVDDNIENYIAKKYSEKKDGYYEIYQKNNRRYFLIGSNIKIANNSITMLNRFDITDTFKERTRQLSTFFVIDGGILIVAFILVGLLAWFLTRNIEKLNETSTRIAEGEYGIRTEIHSRDEIGELSRNFDIMAKSIEQHVEKLEQDVKTREQFVSDFSHELKTPMTSMMGYSQMLLSGNLNDEERMKAEEYIYKECKRLKRLSVSLLKMLGISKEKLELKWIYTEIILENIDKIFQEKMRYSKLSILIEEKEIFTDKDLMVTLIRNLIENGDKACKNRKDGLVQVRGKVHRDFYEVTVTDNGCGMEKEEITKITEPFYMIDKARDRSRGGSGIGLNICKKICETLGITMEIESEINVGTTVRLHMPQYRDIVEEEVKAYENI